MHARLDPDVTETSPQPATAPQASLRAALPDIHDRPRRRLHPMLVAVFAFGLAACAFYGVEAYAPREYRPSFFIGGYQEEITEAAKSGELAAQIRYDAALRTVELVYQDRLTRIQTAAAQWQEHCRAGLANFNNLYQAIYGRANIYVQATAQLQQAYQAMRQQIVAGTLGAESAATNMATMLGLLGGLVDPQFGRQALQFAEATRRQLLSRFDREARGGITISVQGWDSGLPRPDMLPQMIRCDVPLYETGAPRSPIAAPSAAPPRR